MTTEKSPSGSADPNPDPAPPASPSTGAEQPTEASTDKDRSTDKEKAEASFKYVFSPSVAHLLNKINASLWVSTYQAGKLAVLRPRGDKLSMLIRTFDKAMGFAFDGNGQLNLGTRYQIWSLADTPVLAPKIEPKNSHDACFMPRQSHVTGYIDIHEMAWCGDECWFVNTLYSCLCTADSSSSFVPRWQPPFITEILKQDRCHLNGLAVKDGRPKYVTAFSETDTAEGWRQGDHKRSGGVIIDVDSGETIARGLSLPHSPRIHGDTLYALDSGTGRLIKVDPGSGKIDTVATLPGFTRGLAFAGPFAFVGLSRVREKNLFTDVEITKGNPEERKCGIWIVDLRDGSHFGHIEFQETVDEVFDVHLLPGAINPAIIGFEKDAVAKRCVIGSRVPMPGK